MGIFKLFLNKAIVSTSSYANIIGFNGKIVGIESLFQLKHEDHHDSIDAVLGKRFGCFNHVDGNIYVFKTTVMYDIYLEKGNVEFLQYFVRKLKHELRHWHQHHVGKSILGVKWDSFHKNLYAKYGYENCPLEVDARNFENGKVTFMRETISKWISENPDCL